MNIIVLLNEYMFCAVAVTAYLSYFTKGSKKDYAWYFILVFTSRVAAGFINSYLSMYIAAAALTAYLYFVNGKAMRNSIYYSLSGVVLFLSTNYLMGIIPTVFDNIRWDTAVFQMVYIVFVALASIVCSHTLKRWEWLKLDFLSKSIVRMAIASNTIALVSYTVLMPYIYSLTGNARLTTKMGFMIVAIFMICIVITGLINKEEAKLIRKGEQIKHLKARNGQMAKSYEEAVLIKHKVTALLNAMGPMIKDGSREELIRFYQQHFAPLEKELEIERDVSEELKKLKNQDIQNLIHSLYDSCHMNQVGFKLRINTPINSFYMDEDDLFFVLGILFENAEQETKAINNAFVDLYIESTGKEITISLSNTYGTSLQAFAEPVAFKKHGQGLKIAHDVLMRYGHVTLNTMKHVNKFIQKITITI